MLNTNLEVNGVRFSVVGLDHAKFGFYRFQSFLFIVAIVISTKPKVVQWGKLHSDRTNIKSLLRRLENTGMVPEKLYRNTLKITLKIPYNIIKELK